MAQGARPALGLSIGATTLAAVTADHAISRKPVLTLYRQRPPEVGVPSENPRLDEPGLVLTDFVDRVGDPVGIVAADGSVHRSEALVADALRALAYSATGGHPLPDCVAVTHPAHWRSSAVDALATALGRVSEWTHRAEPLTLIPDSAAALFAVRANPGIPARGIVAVCDFGGSGTSITLVDAAAEYQPVARTVRHHDFSGDSIDQALLTYVMSQVPNTGSFDPAGTSAIGSLTRLRLDCRIAKERLSSSTVTTLLEDTPGRRVEIRLTRNELEDTIRDSLHSFAAVLEQMLSRNGINGLSAIVSVGGGATIPVVTTTLSGKFGVPVVTTPRPQLTCAIGGALRAARGPADTSSTILTPAAPAARGAAEAPGTSTALAPVVPEPAAEAPVSAVQPALAWSEADDSSRNLPAGGSGGSGLTSARPQLTFDEQARDEPKPPPVLPWYRLPAVIVISTVVAVVLVGAGVAIGLSSSDQPAKSPQVSTVPNSSVAPSPAPPPPSDGATPEPAPPASQVPETPAPPPAPQTSEAPPPPQTTEAPPPPPPPTTEAPPPPPPPAQPPNTPPPAPQPPQIPQVPAPSPPPVPQIPQIPPIPGIGNIPGIPQVPGVGRISLPRIGPLGPSWR
ncbi:Hsp70 family protein [Mycobacterium kubicae]|uniref:Hsp70 family protein n=1 Tax=Mycobacterium kubicae TaxID=120959 RepID=UPI000800957B|nr:Hsp70 family protein [Mycobacterium kubicae]OBK49805.1 hypothetical protein A5657_21300 [Mycobacterium kubicae]